MKKIAYSIGFVKAKSPDIFFFVQRMHNYCAIIANNKNCAAGATNMVDGSRFCVLKWISTEGNESSRGEEYLMTAFNRPGTGDRILTVQKKLTEGHTLTVSEAAELISADRSSAYRILKKLEEA
jgi:hypothetical protein